MMHQLQTNEVPSAAPLLTERIEECELQGRMAPEFALSMLKLGVGAGTFAAFVDKQDDPGCLLILSVGTMTIFSEKVCLINFMHVAKPIRDQNTKLSLVLFDQMMKQTEAHAKSGAAEVIRASSWVWRDKSSDIGSIYASTGFELQSHEYVKFLTSKES